MNRNYRDILSRIDVAPLWFDECAVPRFCEFSPHEIADIYADECALVLISCQSCEREFHVAMSSKGSRTYRSLADGAAAGTVHFGDPPNVGCCLAGPSMTSNDLRVLQFWRRAQFAWERVPELERVLPDGETSAVEPQI